MQAAGAWEATEGGGPRRKGDSRCRSSGRSRVSGAVGPAAEACTRLGAEPGLAAAAKGPRAARKQWRLGARAAALQARPGAGARSHGGRGVATSAARAAVGGGACVRAFAALPPAPSAARTPRPQVPVQSQPAVFVQLRSSRAAPAHPGAAPAGKPSQATRPAAVAAAPPPPERNVVSAGTGLRDRAWVREVHEGLASCGNLVREPFPFSVCTRERTWKLHARPEFGGQSCRGGREPGPVQLRPKLERLGRADRPHPAHPGAAGCWRTSDLSSFAQPLTPRAAAACGVLPPPHLVLRLVVPVRNSGARVFFLEPA